MTELDWLLIQRIRQRRANRPQGTATLLGRVMARLAALRRPVRPDPPQEHPA